MNGIPSQQEHKKNTDVSENANGSPLTLKTNPSITQTTTSETDGGAEVNPPDVGDCLHSIRAGLTESLWLASHRKTKGRSDDLEVFQDLAHRFVASLRHIFQQLEVKHGTSSQARHDLVEQDQQSNSDQCRNDQHRNGSAFGARFVGANCR